jgi:hypothetical protein
MNTSTSRWLLHRAARPGEMTGDVPQPLMLLSRIGGSCLSVATCQCPRPGDQLVHIEAVTSTGQLSATGDVAGVASSTHMTRGFA